MVIGFHIGAEPHELSQRTNVHFTGPGGAVQNYVEITSRLRTAAKGQ